MTPPSMLQHLLLLLVLPQALAEVLAPLRNGSSIPLTLGPRVPLTKSDPGADLETVVLARRGVGTDEIMAQENNLQGQPGQGYYVTLKLGTPGQQVNVLIDTGSSNFAVAGVAFPEVSHFFTASLSSSYRDKSTRVFVPYTQGSWEGQLGSDLAFLAFLPNGTKTFRTDITSITSASGFFIAGSNWDGIIGLAYASIARPRGSPPQPFFDALIAGAKGKLDNVFSVQLCGSSSALLHRYRLAQAGRAAEAILPGAPTPASHGSFVAGGVDRRLFRGPLLFAPLRKEWYYEVVLTRLAIGGQPVVSDCKELNFDKTIADTGTTDMRLPRRVFSGLVGGLKKAVASKPGSFVLNDNFWGGRTMLCVAVGDWRLFDMFPVLEIDIRLQEWQVMRFKLSPQQYVRYVGYLQGPQRDCFKFGIQSSTSGTVLGSVFLEGFYTVFDRVNKRLGFGESTCSFIGGNSPNSTLQGPLKFEGATPTSDCAFIVPNTEDYAVIEIVCVILGVLCLLIFVPVIVLLLRSRPRPQVPAPTGPPNPASSSPPMPTSTASPGDRMYLLSR